MRCVLICNPAAGTRRERRIAEIDRAAARLRSLVHEALVIATTGPESAADQARDAVRDGAEVVFACGGDGTVHEVLQGLVADDGNPRAALGIVPLGSANALARHLRIPLDAEQAVEVQIRGERITISAGRLEIGGQVRYFAVMAGAGPDGALTYELQSAHKSRLGRLAYAYHAAKIFATHRFSRFAVEYADLNGAARTLPVVSVMASRVDCLGGLFTGLVERGDPLDRLSLRVSLLRPPGRLSLPLWFLTGWLGIRRINPFLVEVRAREFQCRPLTDSDVYCEADGEWLGRIPMRVSVVPATLTVLAPRGVCSASRESLIAGDEAGATREGEVGPGPVGKHRKPIAETDEKEDVDGDPYEPSRETTHVRLEGPLDFADGGHAADGGHVAFVEVAERWARLSGEVGGDHFGYVIAHLHCGLGDAGDLMAVLLEVREVAEDEDIGQASRVERAVDEDAATAVEFDLGVGVGRRAEHLAER